MAAPLAGAPNTGSAPSRLAATIPARESRRTAARRILARDEEGRRVGFMVLASVGLAEARSGSHVGVNTNPGENRPVTMREVRLE